MRTSAEHLRSVVLCQAPCVNYVGIGTWRPQTLKAACSADLCRVTT